MRPSWWARIHDAARLDGAHNGTQIMAYGKGEKLTSMDRTLADIEPVRAQELRERHLSLESPLRDNYSNLSCVPPKP